MELKVGKKYEVTAKGMEEGNIIEITAINGGKSATYKTIKGVNRGSNTFEINSPFGKLLKPLEKECIVIYRNGSETVALDKCTGKKAVATCSPDDTYDFNTGAKLAFERLTQPEVREVKRTAKAGEYVKVVSISEDSGLTNSYKIGDILLIKKVERGLSNSETWARYGTGSGQFLYESEYVVLENYQPPKEEKPAIKPHLEFDGECYGFIGDTTPLKDAIGRELRVGDTVELYDEYNRCWGENVVCYTEDEKKAFVCGIAGACKRNGTIKDGWKVILKRKYEDIADGEVVDEIKYIKGEVQHA